jgi:hypothetical protein
MNSENLTDALNRIENEASTQQIHLADPESAFTVWADLNRFMKYCGRCKTLDAASVLASEQANQEDVYVVYTEITPLGILKFERSEYRQGMQQEPASKSRAL